MAKKQNLSIKTNAKKSIVKMGTCTGKPEQVAFGN